MSELFKSATSALKEVDFETFKAYFSESGYAWINKTDDLLLVSLGAGQDSNAQPEAIQKHFELLIEARFFNRDRELRVFRNHKNCLVGYEQTHFKTDEEENCLTKGLFWTDECQAVKKHKLPIGEEALQLVVRKYYGFDEKGQAKLLDTCLLDCEVIKNEY